MSAEPLRLVALPDEPRSGPVLSLLGPAQVGTDSLTFHAAARAAALLGDDGATISHLARAGRHSEALLAFLAIPVGALGGHSMTDELRNAVALIDIDDPGHTSQALVRRLQRSVAPPFESIEIRDAIQGALTRAQSASAVPWSVEAQHVVTVAHAAALIAHGRYSEARLLGRAFANTDWPVGRRVSAVMNSAWTTQAAAELFEGNVDEAGRLARLVVDATTAAAAPYSKYLATAVLAAAEARRGELVAAERHLVDAQRHRRQAGWPASIAQTAEFVARFYLARIALDVDGMSDLCRDIALVPELSASLLLMQKAGEVFVYVHSGHASQARIAVRQLTTLAVQSNSGALFQALATEIAFEATMNAGDPALALQLLREARGRGPEVDCVNPLLAAAHVALGDGAAALEETRRCVSPAWHHSAAGYGLILLMRAAAHQISDDLAAADAEFAEAILTQKVSPMPALFLMVPVHIRVALWSRVADSRERDYSRLRRILSLAPGMADHSAEGLPQERLTEREMQILAAMVLGGSLEDIARGQFISRNTVKTHVRLIYRKLRIGSRGEATDLMKRFGRQLLEGPGGALPVPISPG